MLVRARALGLKVSSWSLVLVMVLCVVLCVSCVLLGLCGSVCSRSSMLARFRVQCMA